MKEIEISTKGREIVVEPKIVLEIAFSEIVESPEYETGYSIRFPVVNNIRKDSFYCSNIISGDIIKSM